MALRADSSLQFVKGVGPYRSGALAQLGLHTVADLLNHLPFRYEQDQGAVPIGGLRPGARATVRGVVTRVRGRYPGFAAVVTDDTGPLELRWFQETRGGHGLYIGAQVIAEGAVEEFNQQLCMVQPRVRVFAPDAIVPAIDAAARPLPVYASNAQISSAQIRSIVATLLASGALPVSEALPADLLERRGLPAREAALRTLHAPVDEAAIEVARRRLAYEELLLLELSLALRRAHALTAPGVRLAVSDEMNRRIRARFPFALTPAQDAVIAEIVHDLGSGRCMSRLVQGDVGSGKTVIALYACLAAVAHRRQAAIMAPTELLAAQHFANVEKYLAGSRVRRILLRGGMPERQRRAALHALAAGELDLVIGTHALIQREVEFHSLALVVVDEQHKFGVRQRAAFRTKGPRPHYLVMTATPIPRTLAMTLFGDLDVSVVRGSPPGRGRIITRVVTPAKWPIVMDYVRGRIERGEQAYVVCPQLGRDEAAANAGIAPAGGNVAGGKIGPLTPEESAAARIEPPNAAARPPIPVLIRRGPVTLPFAGPNPYSTRASAQRAVPEAAPTERPQRVTVRQAFEELVGGPWKGLRVEWLHGRLPAAEKQRKLDEFRAGRVQALVATTVVEVGVDVPAATIMIVENADSFGLSQLHQLRGRVGRGARDSLCVLVARSRGAKSAERLAVMAKTNDGFRIAEADLKQRGPGQLLGTRQHGLPELRVASLIDDFELLEQARDDAFELVRRDPTLRRPEHARLRAALREFAADALALVDAG